MKTLLILLLISNIFVFSLYVKVKKQNQKCKIRIEDLHIGKAILEKELMQKNMNEDDVHTENFIKFLSDSREAAYGYIEDVQSALKDFSNKVDAKLKYFDEYGLAGPGGPDYELLKQISLAYKELQKIMPND